jgi:hypothetical protein
MAKKDKNTQDQEKESLASGVSKKFKQNPGLYIGSVTILVLVVVTFLGGDLLSGGGFGRRGGDLTFGNYDRVAISWVPGNAFSQHRENIAANYQAQGGDPNDPWIMPQIWRLAFDVTVVDTAVLQIMKKSNYILPDRIVDRNVARLPHFQENGRFSMARYNQMSEASRNNLWRQVQEDIIKGMFYSSLFNLLIPAAEGEFIANMASPVRLFDVISFNVDDYPDSEYLAFAGENAELFKTIHLSKISINNEREAARILESIRDGTNLFEDAARSQSMDGFADRGGDMGSRFFFELDQEIPSLFDRQTITSLERGELSNVINAGNMWVIFRIEDELKDPDLEDETVLNRIRSYVRNFQRGRMEDWAIALAMEFIDDANESGFAAAAGRRSLDIQSFGPLPINYGSLDIFPTLESFLIPGLGSHELGNMARNENFWRIAFSTEINTPSEPFVQGNNVIVFFPTHEALADESAMENIYPRFLSNLESEAERSLRTYFLNHDRMEDNFWDMYSRIFQN